MRTDWDSDAGRSRHLSATEEARLIVNLARFRAWQARIHPDACTCTPCRVRHFDNNRRRAAELHNRINATRGNR